MLEASSYVGIDEVVFLGDFADFYSVSRHRKDPRVGTLLMEEVESVRSGLSEIDSLFPQAKKVFLEGNHEKRLENYLVEQAPALFGVTEVKFLFELNDRPLWTFVPFDRNQAYRVLGSELFAFHRPKASSPKLHIHKTLVSSVYGDIHRIEQARAVGIDKKHLTAVCPGWLGDVSSRVFDYMASTPQWQLGFAIVTLDNASGEFYIDTYEIKNNQTVVQGKVFRA